MIAAGTVLLDMVEGNDTSLSKVNVFLKKNRDSVHGVLKESGTASPVFETVVGLQANNKIFILFQMELK